MATDLGEKTAGAENAGYIQKTLCHRRTHQDHIAAQVAEGGVALLAQLGHVTQGPGHAELGSHADPVHRGGAAPAHVDVGIDEARHDGALRQGIDLGAGVVGQLALTAHQLHPIPLQHHGALFHGLAAVAVQHPSFQNDHRLLLSWAGAAARC